MSVQPLSDTASELSGEALRAELAKDKSHHLGGGRFHNPWPSFVQAPKLTLIKHVAFSRDHRAVNQSIAEGRAPEVVALDHESLSHPSDVQLTWLGHASVLAQIDGATILCDPVFSDRCSPVQWLGPKRYTKAPCQVSELPGAIDVLIISHNHYDHLDWNTLRQVAERYPQIHVYSTLGNKSMLELAGFASVHIGDWWQEFSLALPSGKELLLACTPAQHMTGRGVLDQMSTLWSSWVVRGSKGHRFFFSGDTAYSAVGASGAECPVFRQIGRVYGPFDAAAIAIGAYAPEAMFSAMHVTPEQAVRIHEDIGSKRSVGIHWGTFVLTSEPVDEPPQRLAQAMESRGHSPQAFGVLKIGETTRVI